MAVNAKAQREKEGSKAQQLLTHIYSNTSNDTLRCKQLAEAIEEETDDLIWPLYNDSLLALCNRHLKISAGNKSEQVAYMKYKAEALSNWGYLYNQKGDLKLAVTHFSECLEIEKKINYVAGIVSALNNLGAIYLVQGNVQQASQVYEESLKLSLASGDKNGTADSYNNLGRVLGEQGKTAASIDNYQKALRIKQELNDQKGISICLNNLGAVYVSEHDTARALSFYKQSLEVLEKLGDKEGLSGAYHNLAHVMYERGDVAKAIELLNKGLAVADSISYKAGRAHCLNSLGLIYLGQNNLEAAELHYKMGLVCFEEMGDKQGYAHTLQKLANINFQKGNYNAAKKQAEESLKIAQELGFPEDIKTASGTLISIYSKLKLWQQAFEMLQLYKRTDDSLRLQNNAKEILQKTFQFEYEKKAVADSIKSSEEHKVFEAELAQEKTRRISLYAGLALLALFAAVMFNRYKVVNNQKQIIELKEKETQEQKIIIEEKHKEISDSINYAERIQRSFLASSDVLKEHLLDYFVVFKPKAVVSGDFYWAGLLSNNTFAVMVADSTGHGVPGAIMSLLNITGLETAVKSSTEPAQLLNITRQIIIDRLKKDGSKEGGKDGMDGALLVIDKQKKRLNYAAGNNAMCLVRNGQIVELNHDKMPIGKHEKDQQAFQQFSLDLQDGDVLYAFTDGLPDQFGGPKGKKFMYKQLKALLLSIADQPCKVQKEEIEIALANWQGKAEQVDDITVLGIKF